MYSKTENGKSAKQKMQAGSDKLANAVKVTLGAMGRNVVIQQGNLMPQVTKDGVTVAKFVHPKDQFERIGANLVRQAAIKTVEEVGDSTTTAVVLAQSLINNGLNAVNNGANPVLVKKGMELAVKEVVKFIKDKAIQIDKDSKMLENIATISANNDAELGKLIADIVSKVGKDGKITITESKNTETTSELVDGMVLERGYLSPYFINTNKMRVEYEDALVMVADYKLSDVGKIAKVMESYLNVKPFKPLLIIADDIDGEVLQTLILNNKKQGVPFSAIKVPGVGDHKKFILQDIAIATGAQLISEDLGMPIEKATINDFGTAKRITVSQGQTIISGGGGTKETIENRKGNLLQQIEDSRVDNEKEVLKKRYRSIAQGIGIIRVGAVTEAELSEKKDRVDDAVCATIAALEEGIVAGGGVTHLNAAEKLNHLCIDKQENKSIEIGILIVRDALKAPFVTILSNAGETEEGIKGVAAIAIDEYGKGLNVRNSTIEDFFESGVIDPAKAARVSIENAVSVATLFLTTECCVVDDNEMEVEA